MDKEERCMRCGGPLIEGSLRTRGGNLFVPKGGRQPRSYMRRSLDKCGAVLLAPPFTVHGRIDIKAFLCPTCKIAIIPYG